ncbi:hypothetical protein ACFOX0_11655 [Micromonospora zhanjiangensis]|uniref:Uncharacterized protein n=1 Tax=Micromonospora zhanjiangensis TaxID=1522057 RepID=A0ABV8KKQ7_9ACTN
MVRATPAKPVPVAGTGVVVVLLCLSALAGCGTPPELTEPTGDPPRPTVSSPVPSASVPTDAGSATRPTLPPAVPTPTTGGLVATACAGGPSGQQVVSLLRDRGLLPGGARPTVSRGPLCADDWQYSVVQVPDREPLQVVSTGRPGALTLVTAGTDVCDARVRATAPAGIRQLACEGGPALPPPA